MRQYVWDIDDGLDAEARRVGRNLNERLLAARTPEIARHADPTSMRQKRRKQNLELSHLAVKYK
jgi:hypothetical protein